MNKTRFIKNCCFVAFWLCLAAGVLSSCKEDKQDTGWQNQDFVLDEDLVRNSRDSADFILKKSIARNTRFSTFAANIDFKLLAESRHINFSGQLRVQKDRTLWLTCQKFMFELFRVKITPDTFALYSKLGNTAILYDDDSAKNLLAMSFGLMQALFMRSADSVMFQGERTFSSDTENWIIQGVSGDSVAWQLYIGKNDFRPSGIGIQIKYKGSALQIAVIYQNDDGFSIRLSEDQKLLAEAIVSYSKIRWNETISFPFSIPAGIEIQRGHGLLKNIEQSRENGLMIE